MDNENTVKAEALSQLKEAIKVADDMDNKAIDEESISDDQIEAAFNDANDFVEGLKKEVEDIEPEHVGPYVGETDLEKKDMNVVIDPATGEEKILGPADLEEASKINFMDIINDVNEGNYDFEEEPLTEKDIKDGIDSAGEMDSNISKYLKENDVTPQEVTALLQIINKLDRNEDINVYKELPDRIKTVVDEYSKEVLAQEGFNIAQINGVKKGVAVALMNEFRDSIELNRIKRDFAQDMEKIYSQSSKELSQSSLEYVEERNKAYREAANDIEDEEKRKKLISILDIIDEARALTSLKEYAKKCKIKAFELESYEKVFKSFMNKYNNSNNNIYSLNAARLTLIRNICKDDSGYSEKDINAFLVAFCKQVLNYKAEIATEHAYMYYVIYYCALLDGDKSDTFKNNVKEVIDNIRIRNPKLLQE